MRNFLLMLRVLFAFVLVGVFTGAAWAQTSPGLYNGQVPTAAQWNSYFSTKMDYPTNCPVGNVFANVTIDPGPLVCTAPVSLTGVGSAYRLVTARTFTFSGALNCTTPAFDGSANLTTSCPLAASGVTAGSYGDSTHVAQITVGADGRLTLAGSVAISTGGSGTVTSVTCNSGLTGGTFTTTGTCGLDQTFSANWTQPQSFSNGARIVPEAAPWTNEVGYLGAPENTQNVSYTLVMGDAGKLLYHTNASAHTYTIPANASVAFPIGTTIVIANEHGAGNLTIAITTDTLRWTTSTGSRTLAADGTATLLKVDTTTWRLTGDGIS